MVKTPHTRHSKSTKEPVTIDLAPGEVSRMKAEAEAAKNAETATAPKQEAKAAEPEKTPEPEKANPASTASATSSASSQSFGRKDTSTPPPSAPPAANRSSVVPGAIAGGLVALLVAGGLGYSGLLSSGTTPAQQDGSGPAISALESELATLREQVAALGTGGDDAALTARVGEVEQQVTAFASELETVRGQVGQAGEQAGAPAQAVDLGPLDARIASLEAGLSELRDGSVQGSALDESIVTLREEIVAVRGAQTGATGRLDALEQSLNDLTGKVNEAAEGPSAAVIIAASSLKAAIDRGQPFTAELDTYAALQTDAAEVAELRAMAASGVPTRAQLAAESDAAATAMITAARPVDPDAGIFDRLTASAMGLVQVRPVGMVEGEGVPETAARIDAAVQAGDFARALSEYETLSDTAKAASAGFIEKLRAREAADRLADQAMAAALKT